MGLFNKIDSGLDNTNLRHVVQLMLQQGYTGPVELLQSDYSDDGRLMARAQVLGPFHLDLASIGDKYFCFVAIGAGGEWSPVEERNVYELRLSTAWSPSSKVAKAFIKTIYEVYVIAEAYFKMIEEESSENTNNIEDDDDEDESFDWESYASETTETNIESTSSKEELSQIHRETELFSENEAFRLIDNALEDVLDEILSPQNFRALITSAENLLKEHEIDIYFKIGNKDLDAMFPELTVKASTGGLDDSIFFADKAHWAYFDPSRKGKPYKTTQIGLLEGPELFALYVSYTFLMKATATLGSEEGRKAAEKNNLSLGLMVPILNYFRATKAEDNQTSSLAASAYLDGWQEIVDKYS